MPIKPRITEKATILAENSPVYTFEIGATDTKKSVAEAVKTTYNVTPIKVNIARNPVKKIFSRGKMGSRKGLRKAYVFLKKGDKIEFA
jgi:large subunit ribosomal protein L23